MQKISIILLITAFSLLVGCSSDNKEKQSGTVYITNHRDFYQNGLIYQNSSGKTMFLEFDTMKSVVMCSMPNCNHTTSSCLSELLEPTPIMYNGYAYSFVTDTKIVEKSDGRELSINSKLQRVNMTNFEFEDFCEFSDCTPRIGEGYVLNDNLLYFIGHDENPHTNEYGDITWLSAGGNDYLCCINLDNSEFKNYGLICYVEDNYPTADNSSTAKILGYYNNKIYIGFSFLKDEQGSWELLNFEFDVNSKSLTESELPYAAFINDNAYVYYDKKSNSTVVNYNNDIYNIKDCIVDIYAPVYNDKLFTRDGFYDLSKGIKHNFSEDAEYEVITYYDNSYVVMESSGNFIKLTEDELLALE